MVPGWDTFCRRANARRRVRTAGFEHSQVMEIASQITDRVGPRLNNSPGIRAAQAHTFADLKSSGRDQPVGRIGRLGRGWELTGLKTEQLVPASAR